MDNTVNTTETAKTVDTAKTTDSSARSFFSRIARYIGVLLLVAIAAALFYLYTVRHTAPAPSTAAAPVREDGQILDVPLLSNETHVGTLTEEEAAGQNTETLSTLRADLDRLQREQKKFLLSDRSEPEQWALDEVYFLLLAANERLTMDRDVRLALAALKRAHHRLLGLGYNDTDALRQQILSDMDSLEKVIEPDVNGASATLLELTNKVESLLFEAQIVPLGSSRTEGMQEEVFPSDRLWYQRLWDEMSVILEQLVSVEQIGNDPDFLAEGGALHYKRRLVIELDNARWAALRKNQEVFDSSLERALGLLYARFNGEEREVNATVEALRELSDMTLRPMLPDITGSLGEMEQYRQ